MTLLLCQNSDDITLDADQMIDLYSAISLKTEDTSGSTLKMSLWKTCSVTPAANATDVNYKIRSTIYDNCDSSLSTGDYYWDANTFPGFWYQIKPGLSSELLYLYNDNSSSTFQLGDTIDEGDLYYVSKPQMKKTKIGGSDDESTYIVDDVDLKKYYLLGFFGSGYVAMPENPSSLSAGCKPDKIAKILVEYGSDDKKQLKSGEEWELADGLDTGCRPDRC